MRNSLSAIIRHNCAYPSPLYHFLVIALRVLAIVAAVLCFLGQEMLGGQEVLAWRQPVGLSIGAVFSTSGSLTHCPDAPFMWPVDGDLWYIYLDPNAYRSETDLHLGLDIYADGGGVVPVRAVYDGWLRRTGVERLRIRHTLPAEWEGKVPSRTVETYYTHMASAKGTSYIAFPSKEHPIQVVDPEVWVTQGTIIGYVGNYGYGAERPHLHISVNNGEDERVQANTYDPSAYFGANLDFQVGHQAPKGPMICKAAPTPCQPEVKRQVKRWFQWFPWWKTISPLPIGTRAIWLDNQLIIDFTQDNAKDIDAVTRFVWPGWRTLTTEYSVPCASPGGTAQLHSLNQSASASPPVILMVDWPSKLVFTDGALLDPPLPPPSDPQPDADDVSPPISVPTDGAEYIPSTAFTDETVLTPGASFLKTWRMHNTGTSTWGAGYQLAFISGDQMGAPNGVDLPRSIAPGEEVDIGMNLTAPTTPGSYEGRFRMRDAQGVYFGEPVYVRVSVVGPTTGDHIAAFSADPSSPSAASTVRLYARVNWWPQFRAMRIWVGNQVIGETSTTEYTFNWDAGSYSGGDHTLVLEVADQTDSSWNWPDRRVMAYTLQGTPGPANHAPNRPSPLSPYDWYVYYSGNTAQLCAQANGDPDAGDFVAGYYFDIYDSAQLWNSGWVSSNCVTTGALGPYTYQWRVRVRETVREPKARGVMPGTSPWSIPT